MKEFMHVGDTKKVEGLSQFIKDIIERDLRILDETYGATRDVLKEDGGYTVLIDNKDDFKKLSERHNIEMLGNDGSIINECTDKIVTKEGNEYLSIFFLLNNDYAIIVFVEPSMLPKDSSFLEYDNIKKEDCQ